MLLKNETNRRTVRRSLTLPEDVVQDLDLYARAIDSPPNWVIAQILTKFFAKDKEFLEWKETCRIAAEKAKPTEPGFPKPAREKGDAAASA